MELRHPTAQGRFIDYMGFRLVFDFVNPTPGNQLIWSTSNYVNFIDIIQT
jgi:hypothetical protein